MKRYFSKNKNSYNTPTSFPWNRTEERMYGRRSNLTSSPPFCSLCFLLSSFFFLLSDCGYFALPFSFFLSFFYLWIHRTLGILQERKTYLNVSYNVTNQRFLSNKSFGSGTYWIKLIGSSLNHLSIGPDNFDLANRRRVIDTTTLKWCVVSKNNYKYDLLNSIKHNLFTTILHFSVLYT